MDSKFLEPRPIYREGKKLEMYNLIDELEDKYKADLKASVEVYESYEEVSNETVGDLKALTQTLTILKILGYLTKEETDDMIEFAAEMRYEILSELEKEA